MSTQPLISVCIPAYNAAEYIEDCLNSLINQTYKNIEIIVVNDGSTDNTLQKIQSFSDERIKIINQENKGQCSATNAAFDVSNGTYIKFFDADDILSKDFIKNQVNCLNGKTNAIASASWGRFMNKDLNTFVLNKEPIWRDMEPIEWLIGSLNGASMMQCGIWLIPRAIIEKAGLWNEKLSLINDFEFFTRVLLVSDEVLFTEHAILYYRSGIINSLSASKTSIAYQSAYLSIELGVKTILRFENSTRTKRICANIFKLWSYDFYPSEMDLYHKSIHWVNNLGGSNFKFPAGGKTKLATLFLGWKLVKRIKLGFSKL